MATANFQENTVHYCLFPKIESGKEYAKSFLINYIDEVYAKLAVYLTRHIWQNTCFRLQIVEDVTKGAHLQGFTIFDDCIDDEWFVVFLLTELTKQDTDLVVTLEDSDGQFLLIEAAESLPKWIKPKNSENRVFLYNGALHVIPLEVSDCSNIMDCIQLVRSRRFSTQCSEEIQALIDRKIKEFPDKIEQQKQKTRCYLPAAIVVLLREDSSLISQAVKAFYTRDSIDEKACSAMKHFPPESRVMTNVILTRCMYSQLMCQKYAPDAKIGWNIPSRNSANFKPYDLGMKIASGFEMLLSKYDSCDDSAKKTAFDNRKWQIFLDSLNKNGYFRNFLKGSKDFNSALNAAQMYFTDVVNRNETEEEDEVELKVAKKIMRLLENTEVDYDFLRLEESDLEPEDDDNWMYIEPDDLDNILKRQYNIENENNINDLTSSIPKVLKSFVNFDKSGVEGAEVPNRRFEKTVNDDVKFEVDKFGEALSSILHLRVPQSETDSSSSGMSDYTEDSSESDDELRLLDRNLRLRKENETCKQSEKAAEENELNSNMELYMEAMDKELADTNVGLSFERKKPPLAVQEDDSDSDCNYAPVDVDLTALKNILESYESQQGLPGPAGNILCSMGIHLPQNSDN